ncbi:MAG: sigma-54-dependent Fis family transcriptional regulator, partial [Myxococcales bacterium]|nr:sigma-54-dependent Fis family transcriptional regulator [Myxococcales bacterium]
FLDEIGDVPHTVQLNLLRVLQEREVTRIGDTRPRKVDVRIIAATNADIRQKVDDGLFRHDLYYRIRVATVSLPPLRERRDDIPLLAAAFLARYRVALDRAVRRISNRALRALVEHDWPGNVRELQAVIEFAVIRAVGDEIGLEDLPSELSPQAASPSRNAGPPSLAPADAYDERAEIVATLQRCRGNRAKAARELGMSRATFYRRLTEFGIEPKRLRRSE